jgi:prevent-host-death family protein
LEDCMATVTAFEAKTRFGELLERVTQGEEIVITRHDKPVARIVPEGAQRLEDVRRAVRGLRELQQRIALRSKGRVNLSNREVRSAIEAGRR